MLIHEDFRRCQCGCALIRKEEFVTAHYTLGTSVFVPTNKVIEYTCKDCKKIIHTESIEIAGE
jgi:hypothetical protein